MSTRVVNIRDLPKDPDAWPNDHVYIGRANPTYRLQPSKWRNPFLLNKGGGNRDVVIAAYEQHIRYVLAPYPGNDYLNLDELRDKTLVCWCSPLACHGDVLARLCDADASHST